MPRRGTKTYYVRKADRLFSRFIRMRGKCEAKGADGKPCSKVLHCAHVIPRTNRGLRWDPMNALCMCYRHHYWWAHSNPLEFTDWFREKFPARVKYIEHNKNQLYKPGVEELRELCEMLNKRVKKLEASTRVL